MDRPTLSLAAARTDPAFAAPAAGVRPRLGDILAAQGAVSRAQIDRAVRRQRDMHVRLGDLLRADAGLDDHALLRALESQWSARRIDLGADPPDGFLARDLGLAACLAHGLLPWRRIGAATVIATTNPDRFHALRDDLEARFGPVMMALVAEPMFREALARLFPADLRARSEVRLPAGASCRSWPGKSFRHAALAVTGLLLLGALAHPVLALTMISLVALMALLALTGLKAVACWTALAQRPARPVVDADTARVVSLHPSAELRRPVVSLLVPLLREERIAGRLLRRLGRIKYPRALLDICLVVEEADRVTRDCLAATTLPPHVRVIVVPAGSVKTKPRALNYALDHCRGAIVGVYDAEDAPDPGQIAFVVARFADSQPEVACLQGRLSFYNASDTWLTRCFTIDYAIWFSMVLPGIARLGMAVPLGGTTLFFRREVLEKLGRWDAFNVTEDADLGIRLARAGYRTELIDTTTREEATCHLWPWVRQRSRWLKGYAMTYITHMRDPVRLWRDLGWVGFMGVQVMFLASLLQALTAPVLWSWWLVALGLPHPLGPVLGMWGLVIVTGLLVLSEAVNITLAGVALQRTGRRRLWPWVLTMNAYYMLTTVAAIKALVELLYRPFFWDKTDHGMARDTDTSAPELSPQG
jgi:cellulose synthase/poly-beta-1,6-N-acetylglucosamine synthase-like glycosyltransferase